MTTALEAGLARCHGCGRLAPHREVAEGLEQVCPRCDWPLHPRKPHSLARTLALVLAAAILFVPANTLPVLRFTRFGNGDSDTILSGVVELYWSGDWLISLLVFFASIVVPAVKLMVLGYLVWSVKYGSLLSLSARTRAFRVLVFVGRWSMLDVFVISILVAVVQLGSMATIEAGPGATAFAAVVVLTMLASESFDPRLMWDRQSASEAA